MKNIDFHKDFKKAFKKLPPQLQNKFWERLELWKEQPYHPLLSHHILSGKLEGLHSINITGDVRALYDQVGETLVIYMMIGTHSQLYD